MKQDQFLTVIDRDLAESRWRSALDSGPLDTERVSISEALGRVLAQSVRAEVDVPAFDRSNMDGFAVRAEDTYGVSEENPICLELNSEILATGKKPTQIVQRGTATTIATGGMLPRGADSVVPVEFTDVDSSNSLLVRKPCVPGSAVSYAGTDIGRGETVLFSGTRLSSRETGVLAAIGCAEVEVVRKPRVAIISTGNEIFRPGTPLELGGVYDSNGRILGDAVKEIGAEAKFIGVFRDDEELLTRAVAEALSDADVVLLSGGTSKGQGDLNAKIVGSLEPGVIVHGVALKPGKPICLAVSGKTPIVVLPGFPTSAVFTFHEFVAPLIRELAGLGPERRQDISAKLAITTQSERGRLEYLLVGLVENDSGDLSAYPMGKGSGSVTSFSRADGFVRIGRNVELVTSQSDVDVTLIGGDRQPSDLVIIGSHCVGLDVIAGAISSRGFTVKLFAVGSQAGLAAAERGECDLAPIHLLDPESGEYNNPFVRGDELLLIKGYSRMQGILTRPDESREFSELLEDQSLRMVNRNRGSGTRIVIEKILKGLKPAGYDYEPRSHYAVAAAIAQGRADWGVAIETVARQSGLKFQSLSAERYDFAVPKARWNRPPVAVLRSVLETDEKVRKKLKNLGFLFD